MSCGDGGKKKSTYTGNQVGDFNYTGDFNFVAGGPPGSGISASTTVVQTIPNGLNRRPWLREDARMDDKLLDAAYPTIELQWFVEIDLEPGSFFRLSDKPFYVQDSTGESRYYDPRLERAPAISVTVGEWLTPNYEVSDCQLNINNRDGFFNKYLPGGANYRQWTGAKITVKVGFGEKYENYYTLFEGQVTAKQGLTSDRDSIIIKAYDKLDDDEVPMPPRVFDANTYPDIDTSYSGKGIPLIYGDWTESVSPFGSVVAVCVNANENPAPSYVFKISDLALQSVDELWLHRGQRKEGEPSGPIKILLDDLIIDLASGQVTIPVGVNVLETEITYSEGSGGSQAGVGSGVNLITAKDNTVNFQSARIQVGDKVVKTKTGEVGFITQVLSTQLGVSGGIVFADQDEYKIFTSKYAFIKSDKISVKCKGKNLNLISTKRVGEIDTNIQSPTAIAFDLSYTFWIADDATQKIYRIGQNNVKLLELNYADIDPAITSVSSVCKGGAEQLYITSPTTSTIYRYDAYSNSVGLTIPTFDIVGIAAVMGDLSGIAARSDDRFWIYDNTTGDFYLIDAFTAVQPFVVQTFNRSVFTSPVADEILDISYDEVHDQLMVTSRGDNMIYRIDATDGSYVSSFSATVLADNVNFISGLSVAQDESVFYVDAGTLTIYNYNEQADASTNPAFIARDLLQNFGGHEYAEFDISWNDVARQVNVYRSRAVLVDKANLITYVNKLLAQYNVVFHLRFGRFALFYIDFPNFRTNGRLVTEKDIKENSFRPQKEMNQYFNTCNATYDNRPFQGASLTSDTYVSTAGISFAGREVNKTIDLKNVYRREDLDRLIPLFVKLSVPEPEFIDVTFGFRVLRTQMHDFLTLVFDGDTNCATGLKDSGRRFNHVPCMVRKLQYDLNEMSVTMKLWSLLTTKFPGWIPPGRTVGGEDDTVVLSNIGRLGRFSPVGTINAFDSTSVSLDDVGGIDAQNRQATPAGPCWPSGYKVDLVDGATKEVLQTLTIQSVVGQQVNFLETITATVANTIKNAAGFISGGVYLQYTSYLSTPLTQRQQFGFFTKPLTNYPTSNTQEIEEQRAGTHSFEDGGLPYLIYPLNFVQY